MSGYINPYTLISNGILSEKDEIIIDFLGFYNIKIKIDVVPKAPKDKLIIGGGFSQTKRKKRIKIRVEFHDKNIKDYNAEFYLDNVNLTIKDVKLDDINKIIEIDITNLNLSDFSKKIKVSIDENKIIF